MKEENVTAWCFLTAQFLIRFDSNKTNPHYSVVHDDFLKNAEAGPLPYDYPYCNAAVLIMLCYGLLVYPVEYWKKFLKNENELAENMKIFNKIMIEAASEKGVKINSFINLFHHVENSKTDCIRFIKKLRHAVAHANIRAVDDENRFEFWNIKKEKKDFEVSISTDNLSIFFTGLARYFGTERRNTLV